LVSSLHRKTSPEEIDNTGIWNTPYAINANNTDNYPLKMPYGTLAPQIEQEPFPTWLIVAVFVLVLAVVAVMTAVHFKKRKRKVVGT
jgi:hypothetical protein